MIDQRSFLSEVRRYTDEILLSGEYAGTERERLQTAASRISGLEILRLGGDAARYLAARVRAEFLSELRTTVDYTDTIDQSERFYRLLAPVKHDVEVASRATFEGLRKAISRNRTPTTAYPVYVYQDGEMTMSPPRSLSTDVAVLGIPTDVEKSGVIDGSTSTQITLSSGTFTAEDEGAVGFIEGYDPFYIEGVVNGTTADVDENMPDADGKDVVWINSGVRKLPDVLEPPAVMYATSAVFAMMGDYDKAAAIKKAMNEFVSPILLPRIDLRDV